LEVDNVAQAAENKEEEEPEGGFTGQEDEWD